MKNMRPFLMVFAMLCCIGAINHSDAATPFPPNFCNDPNNAATCQNPNIQQFCNDPNNAAACQNLNVNQINTNLQNQLPTVPATTNNAGQPPIFIPFQSGAVGSCASEAASNGLTVGIPCPNVMIPGYWFSFYSCMARNDLYDYTADRFNDHRDWLSVDFLQGQVIPALQLFTEQMVSVGMLQAFSIGSFFDAKHQLETQRLFQELQVEAHQDYQPSESFCEFGTIARSMADTEASAKFTSLTLSRRQMHRHLGKRNIGGAQTSKNDKINRWRQFTEVYCDPRDNGWVAGVAGSGLAAVCNGGNEDQTNIDIDYTRAIENHRVLDLVGRDWIGAPDELDVLSLSNNLYGHNIITRDISMANIDNEQLATRYLKLRSVAAKRSVAENSFNAIVGLKGMGSAYQIRNTQSYTSRFVGRLLLDLGIPDDEILAYIGQDQRYQNTEGPNYINMSYYGILEVLAKKIYQNPNFYANLYDTPANVKRKSAALKAIELMLDRAIYESQLRQEMGMSVLLSTRLQPRIERASAKMGVE